MSVLWTTNLRSVLYLLPPIPEDIPEIYLEGAVPRLCHLRIGQLEMDEVGERPVITGPDDKSFKIIVQIQQQPEFIGL
jgi:hypothetical protein